LRPRSNSSRTGPAKFEEQWRYGDAAVAYFFPEKSEGILLPNGKSDS
jgi:hypothetical protein